MKTGFLVFTATVFFISLCAPSSACEEYKGLSKEEMKDYRDKLAEEGADELDKMFSFRELVCSDSPTMRAYAIEYGLKSTKDAVLRSEMLLEAMFQKKRIDINLTKSNNLNANDKYFFESKGGVVTYIIGNKFKSEGCINIQNTGDESCSSYGSFVVSGNKVSLTDGDYIGEFELSKANDLIGFYKRVNNGGEKIVASFSLF